MNEFFELEERCKKLRQKKLLKIVVPILLLLLLLIGGVFFFISSTPSSKSKDIPHKRVVSNSVKVVHHSKTSKQEITNKEEKKEKNSSKEKPKEIKKVVEKSENNSSISVEKNVTTTKKKELNKTEKNSSLEVTKVSKIIKVKEEITKEETPIPILTLDINFSNLVLSTPTTSITKKRVVVKRKVTKVVKHNLVDTITFKKAFSLAKTYFENGEYQDSLKWCKIASKLDNENPKIWKLYALNLEQLGDKERAIKVLETYLKHKNSIELKYILERMKE